VLPRLRPVEALVDAAVGAQEQALRRAGVDGQGVAIGVHALGAVLTPGLPPVLRDVDHEAEDVDDLVVRGIHADLAEVERARVQLALALPRLSRVVGAEDAAPLAVGLAEVAGAALLAL